MAIIMLQTRGHKPLVRKHTQHSLPVETQRGPGAQHLRQLFQRLMVMVDTINMAAAPVPRCGSALKQTMDGFVANWKSSALVTSQHNHQRLRRRHCPPRHQHHCQHCPQLRRLLHRRHHQRQTRLPHQRHHQRQPRRPHQRRCQPRLLHPHQR